MQTMAKLFQTLEDLEAIRGGRSIRRFAVL